MNKDTIEIEDKNKTSSVPSINTSAKLKYDADSDTNNIHDQERGNVTNNNITLIRNKSVISQIIKEKYSGMTVSIMLRGIGMITGKVVFNYEGITALQLKNNIIIYVNNNIITDIF